jgi:hypothetical protein
MDGLDAEFLDAVFISRTCSTSGVLPQIQNWVQPKLYQTADSYTLALPYIKCFFFWQKYHDRNKFVFITKPCYN